MSINNLRKNLILVLFILCLVYPLGGCGSKKDSELSFETTQDYSETDNETYVAGVNNQSIFVYVCGAVGQAGVYELDEGSRLYEAIELAGGMNDDADTTYLNMARVLTDGEQVVVYTVTEALSLKEEEAQAKLGLVNINTADITELTTISGIGESRAKAIIDYREKNGAFSSIEDIKNVDGIKDGLFSKIKDKITI
jgi:competence protein ComEA